MPRRSWEVRPGKAAALSEGREEGASLVQAVKKVMFRRACVCCAGKTTDWASGGHRLGSGVDTV